MTAPCWQDVGWGRYVTDVNPAGQLESVDAAAADVAPLRLDFAGGAVQSWLSPGARMWGRRRGSVGVGAVAMTDHPSDITTYCEEDVRVGSVSSSHGSACTAYDVLRMTM